jgi:hypothetical protein
MERECLRAGCGGLLCMGERLCWQAVAPLSDQLDSALFWVLFATGRVGLQGSGVRCTFMCLQPSAVSYDGMYIR